MSPIAALLTGIFLLLFSGCDLFQTRDPEPPTQGSSTYETPTTYDKVLRNLQFSVADKNLNNYLGCFVDTTVRAYIFIAAEDARRGYPDVVSQWSLESEQRYFRNLKEATSSTPSLTIADTPPVYVSTDSVLYDLNYTLFFPHNRSGVPQIVRGNMQLSLGTDGKRWSIHQWRDSKTTSDSTWSYLKAVFSGG
ncbi:MAG: hypothetical protein HY033_10990 [Ignavibacteriae bacterium]|nr:hypothetical protein [Ignavibacteria bacterium]MBI3365424.1 hypothetical protein [Ignavibacteriota bacterium]